MNGRNGDRHFAPRRLALLALLSVSALPISATAQAPTPGKEMILVRKTTKSPDQVVDAIKQYAESKKWVYLGANKVKMGQVQLVKVCIPAVGAMVWSVGLELSALLPCGNLGVYLKDGTTEVSMLDPRFMQLIYPHPDVEKAGATAAPRFREMLDSLAK